MHQPPMSGTIGMLKQVRYIARPPTVQVIESLRRHVAVIETRPVVFVVVNRIVRMSQVETQGTSDSLKQKPFARFRPNGPSPVRLVVPRGPSVLASTHSSPFNQCTPSS